MSSIKKITKIVCFSGRKFCPWREIPFLKGLVIERSKGRISFHPLIKWQKYTEVYIYLSNHRRRKKGRGGGGGGTGGHPPIILEWGQHAFCPPPFNVHVKQWKLEHKCTNLILCALIVYLNVFLKVYFSILVLILLHIISIQCENCNYLALTGGGGSDQFTASEKFAPLAPPPPPSILNLAPPPPPQYSQPSYTYANNSELEKRKPSGTCTSINTSFSICKKCTYLSSERMVR